mmetsp:Transcript_43606/g.74161  ORF Transcript_43606/g.74161 Transcript_43606/m.74161 type:complete len:239 (-) Transcript_43606:223-939(-)
MRRSSSSSSSSISSSGGGGGSGSGGVSNFSSYKQGQFNAIVRYKFVAIHARLHLKEFVLFADGDVVFLRRGFLRHLVRAGAAPVDVAAQCDLMGPVVPHQTCSTQILRREEVGPVGAGAGTTALVSVDYLCSGFLLVRSSAKTLHLFDPEVVLNDPDYGAHLHDQEYFNFKIKPQVRYVALNQSLFPNGSPYGFHEHHDPIRFPPPKNPYIIHFNYFPGRTKRPKMKEMGLWFDEHSV